MSDSFWQFFVSEGRKRLMEYNRKERNNVRVIRSNHTYIGSRESKSLIEKEDKTALSVQKCCSSRNVRKNGYTTIVTNSGERNRIRATELAVMLGWQYTDWQGINIKKLLTNTEKKNLAEGKLTWRSLSIEEYKPIECCSKEAKTTAQKLSATTDVTVVDKVRKRVLTETVVIV